MRAALFLAISRSEGSVTDERWRALLEQATEKIAGLGHNSDIVDLRQSSSAAIFRVGAMADRPRSEQLVFAQPDGKNITDDLEILEDRHLCSVHDLSQMARSLSSISPPSRFAAVDLRSSEIAAGTDALGLGHVYLAEQNGISLVSTSSGLLAALTQAGLDPEAGRVYSLLGCFLGERTMFNGIRKLAAGENVRLIGGNTTSTFESSDRLSAVVESPHYASVEDAATAGLETLRRIFRAYSEAFGEMVVELSGGLDSRLLFALAREANLKHIETMTIGTPGTPDVVIAADLADEFGVRNHFIPVSMSDDWADQEIVERVTTASLRRDYAANPLSGAVYDAISPLVSGPSQLTGQGGELGRGSYYAGQSERKNFDRSDAFNLVRWRLAVNQAADAAILDEDFQSSRNRALDEATWEYFRDMPGGWPAVTDQVYLFGRMQRWAGPAYSKTTIDRPRLSPFFHPLYIRWAADVPAGLRRNSRTFVRMLEMLSPELAHTPLAGGLKPVQLYDNSLSVRATRMRRDAGRATRKVRQRLNGARHAPTGTTSLAAAVTQSWRANPPQSLAQLPWLNQVRLERLLSSSEPLDVPTVAFLVNLEGALATQEVA